FDAFPKLPSTYRSRSSERGILTLFITFIAFLLVANDIAEFIWGWPDYEFGIDYAPASFLDVNVDMIVNMPCKYLSVDLRDALGDRLYLNKGFHNDGTLFDIGQATALKEHAEALTARQVVAESRKSRGFLSGLFRRSQQLYKPTYNHIPDGSACRIYGSLTVKRVTANLHITTLGHGYNSQVHVNHNLLNLSHVITEFSFGKHFPEITQPLDNSFEIARENFVAYQYFLRVVPTTYVAPRSQPLHTNQYSVTHYERKVAHNGVPGIFFKFEIEPVRLSIIQRTTTLGQFFIRWVGVVGGVFVCASWALRATDRVVSVVVGPDDTDSIAPTPDTPRSKWTGTALRARLGNPSQRPTSWVDGGDASVLMYPGSPSVTSSMLPYSPYSPAAPSPLSGRVPSPAAGFSAPGPNSGLGLSPNLFVQGPPPLPSSRTPATAATFGSTVPSGTPSYSHFPPTPRSVLSGFPAPPPVVRDTAKKDD
ncbi:endoplasmic reticulum vesicle transporter-domain-containing protein, partial [Lactifluus volemus]